MDMNFNKYIALPVQNVVLELKKQGYNNIVVCDNASRVDGNLKLVVKIEQDLDTIKIITSDFINK